MAVATLTSKGQLTVPKSVRESLHLHAGDKVEIVAKDGEAVMRPITASVDEVVGLLSTYGRHPRTVEEMDAGIADAVRRRQQ